MIGKGLFLALATTGVAAAAGIAPASLAPTDAAMAQSAATVPASELTFTGIDVDALVYAPVLDASHQQVGEVAELFIDGSGAISGAVIGLGGFFSQREVALDMADMDVLQAGPEGFIVRANFSEDSLNALPTFES
ncbi:PRC-barrel domain-containing protein [Pseudoroseicyclus tamaricis]|uniref:PRC-barrel domain containing protein n=1 Tax=Pseudoroseicyclus tamaricis TaxID=2705421 RepID=A0A6B2JU44_9RHOB|nr:PRC-barrel domain-containing protein [Pseudoroseicyclus tamaricis]NDV01455.1 PRC-barrel domain containing protein [Pseudoroseicyclus tamaricis]